MFRWVIKKLADSVDTSEEEMRRFLVDTVRGIVPWFVKALTICVLSGVVLVLCTKAFFGVTNPKHLLVIGWVGAVLAMWVYPSIDRWLLDKKIARLAREAENDIQKCIDRG